MSKHDIPWSLAAGDELGGRYCIVAPLGRGGIGEVYEAEDRELGERVAVKVVRPEVAAEERTLRRFKREIQLARRVTHPNVCRTFDLGPNFLTMELLRGETLAAHLERCGRCTPEAAMPIVEGIVAGLAAAHAAGVVHRDLKTSNIFLESDGRVVITDFGLARDRDCDSHEETTLTVTGEMMGSPAYMAPEQVRGERVTPATDLYSLGVVLFEMVTGQLPFRGESAFYTALKRLQEAAPSPRALVPDLDPRWEAVILRCLARRSEERFPDAPAVLAALCGQGEGMDPTVKPSPRWRRPAVLGGGLIALLVAGLIAVGGGRWVVERLAAHDSAPSPGALSAPAAATTGANPEAEGATLERLEAQLDAFDLPGAEATWEALVPNSTDPRLDLLEARLADCKGETARQAGAARRALERGRGQGMPEIVVEAALYQARAWRRGMDLDRAQSALEAGRQVLAGLTAPRLEVRYLSEEGTLDWHRDALESAEAHFQQALELARRTAYPRGEMEALRNLASVRMAQRQWREAGVYSQAGLEQARALGDRFAEAILIHGLGYIASQQGNLQGARERYREALGLWRQIAAPRQRVTTLQALGHMEFELGDLQAARACFEESTTVHRTVGNLHKLAEDLQRLAMIDTRQGAVSAARERLQESLALARSIGAGDVAAGAQVDLGELLLRQGRLPEAEALFRAAREAWATGGAGAAYEAAVVDISLARLLRERGELASAAALLESALDLFRQQERRDREALAWRELGWTRWAQGHLSTAATALEQAAALASAVQDAGGAVTAHAWLARVRLEMGDPAAAGRSLEAAHAHLDPRWEGRETALVFAVEGLLRAAEGDWPGAREAQQRAARIHHRLGDSLAASHGLGEQAQVALAAGLATEAEALAAQSADRLHRAGVPDGEARALLVQVCALLAQGSIRQARRVLDRGQALVERSEDPRLPILARGCREAVLAAVTP